MFEQSPTNDLQRLIFAQFGAPVTKPVNANTLGGLDHIGRSAYSLSRSHAADELYLGKIDSGYCARDLAAHLFGYDNLWTDHGSRFSPGTIAARAFCVSGTAISISTIDYTRFRNCL